MSAPERTEVEMAERIAAFEEGEPAPESMIERVAVALWKWDVKDEATVETLNRMWPKVVASFPTDAAHYRGAAQHVLDAIKADQA